MKKKISELLKNYKRYNQLNRLEDNLLDQGCVNVGSGSSRVVYRVSATQVVKIAISAAGTRQNKVEYKVGSKGFQGLITKVHKEFNNCKIIVADYVKPLSEEKFKKIYGITFRKFGNYVFYEKEKYTIDYFKSDYFKKYCKKPKRKLLNLLRAIHEFCEQQNMTEYELVDIWQWGIVNNRAIILDYGLNQDIYVRYYAS